MNKYSTAQTVKPAIVTTSLHIKTTCLLRALTHFNPKDHLHGVIISWVQYVILKYKFYCN